MGEIKTGRTLADPHSQAKDKTLSQLFVSHYIVVFLSNIKIAAFGS